MSSLRELIVSLVHADARASPVERARHCGFIASRLAASLALLAILPPFLIYHGLPNGWQAVALMWLLVPPAAVLLVVRTGRLALAQTLCMASTAGAAVALFQAQPSSVGILAWLVLLPLEALLFQRPAPLLAAGAAALLIVAVVLLAPQAKSGAVPTLFLFLPPLLYATGLVLGVQCVGDVRNSLHHGLEDRFAALVDVAGDAVVQIDLLGAVVSADDKIEALMGVAPHVLRGRGLFERINVADRPAYLKAVADAQYAARPLRVVVRVRTTVRHGAAIDASQFCAIEMRLVRFDVPGEHGVAGAVTRVMAVLRDVTPDAGNAAMTDGGLSDGGSAAAHRTSATAEPGHRNLWKDRFLATVSHELRTPLNAIIGFSEILSLPELAPRDASKQREYAEIINTSGQHLLAVVNSILDVSKIEAGSFDIVPEPFDVASLIDASCDMVSLKITQGGLVLSRACDAALPELVADKRACRQILINLLSNAIKFTPPTGQVTVGARPDGADCVLFVTDTGIGISARDLPRLGAPFFQAQGSYDRRYEGTGLGLSVVRGLVGLHGGTIAIASAPGAGTSVEIRLPFEGPRALGTAPGMARIETGHSLPPSHTAPADPMKVKKIA